MKNTLIIVGATLVLVFVLTSLAHKQEVAKTQEMETSPTREIALSCTTDMATQFHIHPILHIIVNGEEVVLPEGVGIDNGCMHPLHTHDDVPVIHVEAPVQRDFTLGDFFAVWDKPFSKDVILDNAVDATHTIVMTVNGEPVDTFENTILHDKDVIVISYQAI